MSNDLQDFWCYNNGDLNDKAVKIQISKFCPICNQAIPVSPGGVGSKGVHYADSFDGVCQHLQTYLNVWKIFVTDKLHLKNKPSNISNRDGSICKKCNEFYPYAISNQSDGSMICYGCRMDW